MDPRQQLNEVIRLYLEKISAAADLPGSRRLMEEWSNAQTDYPHVRRAATEMGGVPVEWVTPESGSDADPVILFLHGGGYMAGSVTTHIPMIAHIAAGTRTRALGVNYRLAPEHSFPAAIEDVVAVYHDLLRNGYDPSRIAFVGDSAGGGLVVSALLLAKTFGMTMPAAAVMSGPWVDLAVTGASMVRNAAVDPLVSNATMIGSAAAYLGGTSPYHPLASPIYADLSELPPVLIHVGTTEALLDDALRLEGRANACGVSVNLRQWEEMPHGWHQFAGFLPEAREAIADIDGFLGAIPGWR